MRITNNANPYQAPAQKVGTIPGTSGGFSFGSQLDIAARRSADRLEVSTSGAAWQNAGEMDSSPYLKLMESYSAWKAQQPPQDLPDSWGPTEENLAYLKERYTGDLSWEERVDALETMVHTGVITRDQRNEAMGSTVITGSWEEVKGKVFAHLDDQMKEYHAYYRGGWDMCFQDRLVSKFKTADDLFSWLDELLANENA